MSGRSRRPVARSRGKPVLFFLLAGFLLFGALGIKLFTVPTVSLGEPDRVLYQRIEYDYRVYPVESILFPAGSDPLPPGSESFYGALTERIQFQVSATVEAAEPPEESQNKFAVELNLCSGEQWRKKMPLKPVVTVTRPQEKALCYRAVFDLPLEEARQLGEAILEEIEGRSWGDSPSLVISTTLDSIVPGAGHLLPEENSLKGEYEFILDEMLLQPRGDLLFEDAVMETGVAAVAENIVMLRQPVDILTGRVACTALFLLFGTAAVCSYLKLKTDHLKTMGKREQLIAKSRKMFGSRLIKGSWVKDISGFCKVEIADYRELAKIADEVEKPIVEIAADNNPEKQQTVYYVADGKTLYHFKV